MTPFRAVVSKEGKAGRYISIPAPILNQLTEVGFRAPGWARVTIGERFFYGVVRLPPSRSTAVIALPLWRFTKLRAGTKITATVEDATLYRAKPRAQPASCIDWLDYVDDSTYFPTHAEGSADLLLWSRREAPFTLHRITEIQDADVLAEHTPSNIGQRIWSFATADQQKLEDMKARLERLGVSIYVFDGKDIWLLSVRRSLPLIRLLRRYIEKGRGGRSHRALDFPCQPLVETRRNLK